MKNRTCKTQAKKQTLECNLSKKYYKDCGDSRRSGVQVSLFSDLETFWCLFGPQTVSEPNWTPKGRQNGLQKDPKRTQMDPKCIPQKRHFFLYMFVDFDETLTPNLESTFKLALQGWKRGVMSCFKAAGFREAY